MPIRVNKHESKNTEYVWKTIERLIRDRERVEDIIYLLSDKGLNILRFILRSPIWVDVIKEEIKLRRTFKEDKK